MPVASVSVPKVVLWYGNCACLELAKFVVRILAGLYDCEEVKNSKPEKSKPLEMVDAKPLA